MNNDLIFNLLEDFLKEEKEMDIKYPNRHKEIHKVCCKHCPTENTYKNGGKDLEVEDLRSLPKEVLVKEYLFVCAWRRSKLCRGLCDQYEIDQEFLDSM